MFPQTNIGLYTTAMLDINLDLGGSNSDRRIITYLAEQ